MRYFFKVYVLGIIIFLSMIAQSIIDSGSEYLVDNFLQVIYQPNISSELSDEVPNSSWQVDEIFDTTK
ncbi:hypothetical protein ACFL1S_06475 [Pseudomonadota bacterium]